MKKLIYIGFIITILLNLCSCSQNNNHNEPEILAPNGDYSHELFENCYILGGGINENFLVYNEEKIFNGTFYKYSSSNNRFVAIHNMELTENVNKANKKNCITFSMEKVMVNNDYFIIFDTKNKSIIKSLSIDDFNQKCLSLKIEFDNWYYGDTKSVKIDVTNNCYIENCGNYRGQILFVDNLPLFEGIIDTYTIIDNNTLALTLQIADLDYGPEFPNITNKNLDYKTFAVNKKYHSAGLLFHNIKYSSYIMLNTNDKSFHEFSSKKDIEQNTDKKLIWYSIKN